MGDHDDGTSEGPDVGDATVSLSRDELAPPPPPPDPVDPADLRRSAAPPPPPGRRGRGAIWIGVVLALTAAFVVACYVVVAQSESDRDDGPSTPPSTTRPTTTTGSTTTTTAAPVTHDPAQLTVAVLNGTEQQGWAGDTAAKLAPAGYQTETTDAVGNPETTTVYIASEDLQPDGAAIAELVGFPDAPVEARPGEALSSSGIDQDVDVVVLLGADSLGG